MDHAQAHIIHFAVDTSSVEIVWTHSKHPHLHIKAGRGGTGRAPESTAYFDEIVKALGDTHEILLMGPSNEKDEFMRYIAKHHFKFSERIVATLTADHPTDPQLLAFARKYFVKMDRMNEDPGAAFRHDN